MNGRIAAGPTVAFLDYRRRQVRLALAQSGIELAGTIILEVGGGVSGQATELSRSASKVVCSDLLESASSYGGDLRVAARLTEQSDGRLAFVCGRGEQLPFRSQLFDVVYSSYVFEHIPDRVAAAEEVARVLRPGGVAITNVPNTMEPVLRGLWTYTIDVPKQLIKALLVWTGVASALRLSFSSSPPSLRQPSEVFRWLRRLLLEHPPHGEYRNRLEEVLLSRPTVWQSIFEDAGLQVERDFTVCLDHYVPPVSEAITVRVQAFLAPLVERFGASWLATKCGSSYCFVSRKPRSGLPRTGGPERQSPLRVDRPDS